MNDNLDAACSIVKEKAGDQAVLEIDYYIQEHIAHHHEELGRTASYQGLFHSFWADWTREPLTPSGGGLSQAQLAMCLG